MLYVQWKNKNQEIFEVSYEDWENMGISILQFILPEELWNWDRAFYVY
jgi:hypothetical protein